MKIHKPSKKKVNKVEKLPSKNQELFVRMLEIYLEWARTVPEIVEKPTKPI